MTSIKKLSLGLLSFPLLSIGQMCGCGVCAKASGKVDPVINRSPNQQLATMEIKITEMSCAECANHIHTALSKTEGVMSDEVKYPGDIAIVKYYPSKISKEQIINVIEKAWYKAEVKIKSKNTVAYHSCC